MKVACLTMVPNADTAIDVMNPAAPRSPRQTQET